MAPLPLAGLPAAVGIAGLLLVLLLLGWLCKVKRAEAKHAPAALMSVKVEEDTAPPVKQKEAEAPFDVRLRTTDVDSILVQVGDATWPLRPVQKQEILKWRSSGALEHNYLHVGANGGYFLGRDGMRAVLILPEPKPEPEPETALSELERRDRRAAPRSRFYDTGPGYVDPSCTSAVFRPGGASAAAARAACSPA